MNSGCRRLREMFLRDNGDGDMRAIEEHMAACPDCAREMESYRALRNLLGKYDRPELSPEAWSRWDDRLERALDAVDGETAHKPFRRRFPSDGWKWRIPLIAATAAALLLGFFATKAILPGLTGVDRVAGVHRSGGSSLTVVEETRRYLDRSKLVLLGIAHAEPTMPGQASPDIVHMKRIAGELLRETPDLRRKLAACHSYRLAALLEEMEVVLLQISTIDEKNSVEELELVQTGVERKGLLFKIDLENLAAEAAGTIPSPGPLTAESNRNL